VWLPVAVLLPPVLDEQFDFLQRVEDLPLQQLIAQIDVEALELAVPTRAPRLNEQRADTELSRLPPDPVRRELMAIILSRRSQERRARSVVRLSTLALIRPLASFPSGLQGIPGHGR
jgi:hypothetical protein